MSQQTIQGRTVTSCDDPGCNFSVDFHLNGKKEAHRNMTNSLKDSGWSFRRKKITESFIVNPYRHRCPKCTRDKGKLK